jgi:hypothetical protein
MSEPTGQEKEGQTCDVMECQWESAALKFPNDQCQHFKGREEAKITPSSAQKAEANTYQTGPHRKAT